MRACNSAWGSENPAPAHLLSVISYHCQPISLSTRITLFQPHIFSSIPETCQARYHFSSFILLNYCLETSSRSIFLWLTHSKHSGLTQTVTSSRISSLNAISKFLHTPQSYSSLLPYYIFSSIYHYLKWSFFFTCLMYLHQNVRSLRAETLAKFFSTQSPTPKTKCGTDKAHIR